MPEDQVRIRVGETDQIPAVLAALADSAAAEPGYLAAYRQRIRVAAVRLDALSADHVVGSILIERPEQKGAIGAQWVRHVGPDAAELGGLFVRSDWTGRGIAGALMGRALHFARDHGWQPVIVIRQGYPQSAALVARFGGQSRRPFAADGRVLLPFVFPR